MISKGFFSCRKQTGNTVLIEKKYFDLIKNPYLDLMTHKKSVKLPINQFVNDLFLKKQANNQVAFNVDHLCSFPLVSYIPQAILLWLTTLLDISPYISIYLGRFLMGVLSYLLFLYLYRKIEEHYKLILVFVFALPMTMHQVSSFSYDVFNIMLALTFFTFIANNFQRKKIAWIQLVKILTVLFLFLWSKKIGYEPLFLLLFLLPLEAKTFITSILVFIPLYCLSKINGSHDLQYSLSSHIYDPVKQMMYLMNPFNFLKVLAYTTVHRIGFYLQSLIGIFGWLEYGLDPLSYFLYGLSFIYVLLNTKLTPKQKLSFNKTVLLLVTLIISYMFIILLAFVFNTLPGNNVANGVQGRYFIPILPFALFFLIQIKDSQIFQKILSWSVVIFLISAVFFSIFRRYY